MLIAVAGIFFCSFGLSDAQRIPRFIEFQWQLGIQDHGVEFVAAGNVAAALNEVILCIDRFSSSLRVLANDVFEHHDVAGLPHGIIRFCGND